MEAEEFDSGHFEKKLTNLKDTQESIQAMSTWCLERRNNHKKIVSSWLNVLKQVKVDHRLTLFYLANDVIQYSKRKNFEFVESWGTTLQRATTMVRDEKVKHKILRIFKIWEQRGVYNEEFLADLNGLLSVAPVKKPPPKEIQLNDSSDEFQASYLISNIRDCVKLEKDTDKSFKVLSKSAPYDLETIKSSLKDRSHVDDAEKDLEKSYSTLEAYVKTLNAEIKARGVLIVTMEQAEAFYHTQRDEVKVVANAYKNFGNRIKNMKKRIEEMKSSLPSPIPSPDINAPSPEPDNDINLPDDCESFMSYNGQQSNGFVSYMDGTLPFDINDFRNESTLYRPDKKAQPIQVISSRVKEEPSGFNDDFFKSIPTETYAAGPQPVPPVHYLQNDYAINHGPPAFGVVGPQVLDYQQPGINVSQFGADMRQNFHNAEQQSVAPLRPPPLPPSLGRNDEYNSFPWDINVGWNPAQDGNFNHAIETPVSPPLFERKGHNENIIEYIDQPPNDISPNDVDHRQLNLPIDGLMKDKARAVDIDHRNLISLTGSPLPKATDRSIPPPPIVPSLLWTNNDADFRTDGKEILPDSDFRVPPAHGSISNSNIMHDRLLPPPPPPTMTIDPSIQDDGESASDQNFGAHGKMKSLTRHKQSNKCAVIRDNVESVDMEMSDEDNEDHTQNRNEQTFTNPTHLPPNLLHQQSGHSMPPEFVSSQSPHVWNRHNNSMSSNGDDDWENTAEEWDGHGARTPIVGLATGGNGNVSNNLLGLVSPRGGASGVGSGISGGSGFFIGKNQTFASPPIGNNIFRGKSVRARGGSPYFRARGRGGFRGNFRGNGRGTW